MLMNVSGQMTPTMPWNYIITIQAHDSVSRFWRSVLKIKSWKWLSLNMARGTKAVNLVDCDPQIAGQIQQHITNTMTNDYKNMFSK